MTTVEVHPFGDEMKLDPLEDSFRDFTLPEVMSPTWLSGLTDKEFAEIPVMAVSESTCERPERPSNRYNRLAKKIGGLVTGMSDRVEERVGEIHKSLSQAYELTVTSATHSSVFLPSIVRTKVKEAAYGFDELILAKERTTPGRIELFRARKRINRTKKHTQPITLTASRAKSAKHWGSEGAVVDKSTDAQQAS